MAEERNHQQKDVSLESLQAQLRNLPEPDVPEGLKSALFAGIPEAAVPAGHRSLVGRHPGAWDFGVTAAAAVVILALLLMVNYGLSVPAGKSLVKFDEPLLSYTRWDHNTLLSDQNNAFIERVTTHGLK